ncbi:hypothetical protein [Candidatus Methylacidithermus pantelleriae]|uniref:hypothetical protein n=1 Tax=Candidatus Methylacidithermus pantelleriae TaxID=2744239 RepID=UPI00157DE68E|nr:hypothetical protein [Candidatus Methylacidithermus pantelleriae]
MSGTQTSGRVTLMTGASIFHAQALQTPLVMRLRGIRSDQLFFSSQIGSTKSAWKPSRDYPKTFWLGKLSPLRCTHTLSLEDSPFESLLWVWPGRRENWVRLTVEAG